MRDNGTVFWQAQAPSNIALIKYAGKKDSSNLPVSPSLSYTLDHLTSIVRIHPLSGRAVSDGWEALDKKAWENTSPPPFPLKMSSAGVEKFLKFFQLLKTAFHIPGFYKVQSGNNFPMGTGVASSASSFCALTRAAYQLGLDHSRQKTALIKMSKARLSALSREGSGSSCRSFFSPWALWEQEQACPITLPYPKLIHQLVITSTEAKKVSSSAAHWEVLKSPFFKGRVSRASERLSSLLQALKAKNWPECFKITWEEFQDLHQLYETATPPIPYRNPKSLAVLDQLKALWDRQSDGPLVTMDAGPHVHLLYRMDQQQLARDMHIQLSADCQVLSSPV